MNGKRAFELLEKIGFVRMGGTLEEKEAAKILKEEVEKIGGEAKIEDFEVRGNIIHKAKLEVLEPNYKEYPVTGFLCSGSTPEDGLVGDFYYVSTESIVDMENAKGKIVLVNGPFNVNLYKKLVEAGIIGFITFNGDLKDNYEDVDINYPEMREPLRKVKVLPGVNMKVHDAVDLVLSEAKKVKLTLIQEEKNNISQNVVSVIEGTEKKDEEIVFTAHYDSVRYSTGVYDNGAGSVILMEAYRYFMENKPKRTYRFIWCGSEERGLLGSKAYVRDHEEDINKVKFNINCDVAGPVLGRDVVFATANNEVLNYCKALGSEIGFPANYVLDTYSSDGIPFADKGIASVSITRFGVNGTAYIHNRHDVLKYLDYKNLEKTGNYLIELAKKIDASLYMPFDNKVSEEVKDKVDKYLYKK